MKALVLAGGTGSRLRPLSHSMAKQLVPVAGKPVLLYGLEALRAAGITDVGIVVGDRATEIADAVGDGSALGLDITLIPQDAPLGLAHCVLIARAFLGDDDFVMYLGDNILIGGLGDIVDDFAARRPDAQIMLAPVPDPEHYGVAELDADGQVVRLQEKPAAPASDLALIGVYVFSKKIHAAVASIRPSHRSELEITDAIQWLIDHDGTVESHVFTGYWKDTGRIEDLLACNRRLLRRTAPAVAGSVDARSSIEGAVAIAHGADVRGSRIVGPAVVGRGARLSDCDVGPYTAIGADCRLTNATIDDSIVMARAELRDVHGLSGSLIGREASVTAPPDAADGNRVVVGDHSRLRIAGDCPRCGAVAGTSTAS